MNGQITARQLVATYRAPAEPEPSEVPSLMVRRAGSGLAISWTGSGAQTSAAAPIGYDIDVSLSTGARLLRVVSASARTATIANVASGTGVAATVAALRADDTQGVARSLTLAPGKSSASS
jgi:hypothetical protein